MDEYKQNLEIEKIANLMVHDNISVDEQDIVKLEKYKNQIKSDCDVEDEEAMKIVYETLLYRKLKSSESSDVLKQGTDFGAGFSLRIIVELYLYRLLKLLSKDPPFLLVPLDQL